MYFSFDFGQYSIHLDIVRSEQWGQGFLLNGKNLLSVTNAICQQSLKSTNDKVQSTKYKCTDFGKESIK